MNQDKVLSAASSDSGYDSLEGSVTTTNNRGKLSIFTLGDYYFTLRLKCVYLFSMFVGKIYRWLARGKIMAIFAKSFMMSSKPLTECKPLDHLKGGTVISEKHLSRSERYLLDSVELRAYPDPANNIDDADRNVKIFDDPNLIRKWISRAHGNNEMSARIYRSYNILFSIHGRNCPRNMLVDIYKVFLLTIKASGTNK